MYLVYILSSQNKTYVGMTNDFFKRWKQHNGILKGVLSILTQQPIGHRYALLMDLLINQKQCKCEWLLNI